MLRIILRSALLLQLGGSGLAAFGQVLDPSLDQFEDSINAFEQSDKEHPVTKGGTLFVGSSTFVLWPKLEKTFKKYHATNRAFGGSNIPQINHYIDRIVLPYAPTRIVFYAGSNDIAQDHSAKRVFDDFHEFEQKVHTALPDVDIYYVSMSVAPSRLQYRSAFDEGNKLIKQYADQKRHVIFIDVIPLMTDSNGRLKESYFSADKLHMKPIGYRKWVPTVKQGLDTLENDV